MPRSSNSTPNHSQTKPILYNAAPPTPRTPVTVPAGVSLGQTLKEGFGFGVGSAVAHNAINSIFRHFQATLVDQKEPKKSEPCDSYRTDYEMCIKTSQMDANCTHTYYPYKQCLQDTSKIE